MESVKKEGKSSTGHIPAHDFTMANQNFTLLHNGFHVTAALV